MAAVLQRDAGSGDHHAEPNPMKLDWIIDTIMPCSSAAVR
jgi:hypothetical protein